MSTENGQDTAWQAEVAAEQQALARARTLGRDDLEKECAALAGEAARLAAYLAQIKADCLRDATDGLQFLEIVPFREMELAAAAPSRARYLQLADNHRYSILLSLRMLHRVATGLEKALGGQQ